MCYEEIKGAWVGKKIEENSFEQPQNTCPTTIESSYITTLAHLAT
jgi:hypothetical protein